MSQQLKTPQLSKIERQILNYIRTVDGWVFREQIEMVFGCSNEIIDAAIQKYKDYYWVKGDIDAEGIVSIPSMRGIIDTHTLPFPTAPLRISSIQLNGSAPSFFYNAKR